MPRSTLSVLLCACVSAACGETRADAAFTVRDSSGVEIVENARPAWAEGAGWRLSAEPVLRIGTPEGEPAQELHWVTDVLRLPDGRIVVANDGTGELRYFAPGGRFLGAAGRRGEGPGEFQGIGALWGAGGDTVVAHDPLLHRLTTFAGTGTLVRSEPLGPIAGGGPLPPEVLGRFGDGDLLVRALAPLPLDARRGMRRDSAAWFRVRPGDGTVTRVGRFPGDESFVVREGNGVSANRPPFGRRTHAAAGGDHFFVGTGDVYRIDAHAGDGRVVRSIRAAVETAAITGADADRYRSDYLARVSPASRPRLERLFAQMPTPETFPAHGRLLVDSEGRLWVARYPRPGETRRQWDIFDSRGTWLGTLTTPERFEVLEVRDGFVLGTARDEDEVEMVLVFRIEQ